MDAGLETRNWNAHNPEGNQENTTPEEDDNALIGISARVPPAGRKGKKERPKTFRGTLDGTEVGGEGRNPSRIKGAVRESVELLLGELYIFGILNADTNEMEMGPAPSPSGSPELSAHSHTHIIASFCHQ